MHGTYSSADASAPSEANARFVLYADLGVTSLSLNTSDVVVIQDIIVASAGTNLTVTIYDGADNSVGAGEIVWKGVVATNTTQSVSLNKPHRCQKGTYPKVLASGAGQIDLCIKGDIYRVGV
jgi:hypothetical protein